MCLQQAGHAEHLPGMDGVAAARAIREGAGNDLPIVITSDFDWSDIEQEARAAGANAFLAKPFFRSRSPAEIFPQDLAQMIEVQGL